MLSLNRIVTVQLTRLKKRGEDMTGIPLFDAVVSFFESFYRLAAIGRFLFGNYSTPLFSWNLLTFAL